MGGSPENAYQGVLEEMSLKIMSYSNTIDWQHHRPVRCCDLSTAGVYSYETLFRSYQIPLQVIEGELSEPEQPQEENGQFLFGFMK